MAQQKKQQEIKDEDKFTQIYLVTNCFGDPNKVYIGKEKSHQINARKSCHKTNFNNQIIFTFIDKCNGWTKENWKPLECFWIEQFRQWGFEMMNKNKGGGGLKFVSEETKIKLRKPKSQETRIRMRGPKSENHKLNMRKKSRHTEEQKLKWSLERIGKNNISENGRKKISKIRSVPVYQYGTDGIFIKEWKNIKTAEKEFNIYNISACCRGIQKTAGKYIWKYIKHNTNENIINPNTENHTNSKPVLQYNMDGNFIMEWSSVTEAYKYFKGDIYSCCNRHNKTSVGYLWKYKNGL